MGNSFYDTQRSGDTLLGLADLSFNTALSVTINPPQLATFDLDSQTSPDVGTLPGSTAAFLVLRALILDMQDDQRQTQGNREGISTIQTVSVPIGGGVQIFQLPGSTSIASLGFQSFTAAIGVLSVSDVQIDDNDGNFQEVFLPSGNIGGTGVSTLLSLINQFGPYGYETFRNARGGGMRVRLNINNTSGAPQSFGFQMNGSKFSADLMKWTINYIGTNQAAIPLIDGGAIPGKPDAPLYLPLNIRIPVAMVDPGQKNYGGLTFSPEVELSSYSTQVTLGITVLASLLYLLPGVN